MVTPLALWVAWSKAGLITILGCAFLAILGVLIFAGKDQ
jgi:hypothetical protein